MVARTDAVEQALSLRQWGGPFDALASVLGRDAMFWYRAWLAFGRPSLVGTTVKDPQTLPRDVVADEQLTRVAKQQVYVPTTVGGGCFLGVSVVEAADTVTLERGYGECAKEARALAPAYQARSVCTDGWEATRQAGRGLFPTIKLVLCFPHAILKSTKHCAGQLRHQVLAKAWQVYQATTTRQFAQRLRRVAEWTPAHLRGARGPDGGEEVSPSHRRHPSLGLSTGPPHLQCRRSAARRPRSAARRHALLAWHHCQRAPRRTCDGAAMEFAPVWHPPAACPTVAGLSLSRPERLAVSPQLVA
jgi:hypothetical protein